MVYYLFTAYSNKPVMGVKREKGRMLPAEERGRSAPETLNEAPRIPASSLICLIRLGDYICHLFCVHLVYGTHG